MKREYEKPETEISNVRLGEIMESGVATTSPSDEVGSNTATFESENGENNQLPTTFSLWDEEK